LNIDIELQKEFRISGYGKEVKKSSRNQFNDINGQKNDNKQIH
jgi:predicted transcriptional regulator YdeE